ncbi:MAG: hypothetical protein KC766_03765, partial [Myxococcales bacterium]|nr:hypothetical protein [Myxococcales bacterium]
MQAGPAVLQRAFRRCIGEARRMRVDAWIQHPTPEFIRHEMFASLRRWMRLETVPDEIPLELTLGALDVGGID